MKYFSLTNFERYMNNTLVNRELRSWIEENVEEPFINYALWSIDSFSPRYIVGITLDEEQAIIFKLKFGL